MSEADTRAWVRLRRALSAAVVVVSLAACSPGASHLPAVEVHTVSNDPVESKSYLQRQLLAERKQNKKRKKSKNKKRKNKKRKNKGEAKPKDGRKTRTGDKPSKATPRDQR